MNTTANAKRILIVTQKIDREDGALSFMLGWIREFARECDEVTVIALYVGEHDLPENVKVLSLGKEDGAARLKYVFNLFRYAIRERNRYDSVFVHMNQIYVLLAGPLWKLMGKGVALWYAHGSVSLSLRIASWIADPILTSSPSGFRLRSPKLRIVGQGIDTERFSYRERFHEVGSPIRLLVVGRISPSKDIETLLRALPKVRKRFPVLLDIVGGPGTPEQVTHLRDLERMVEELSLGDVVRFHGSKPHEETVRFFHEAHVFVSSAVNGSFDKAMGDAMSTGLPLVCCNDAMKEVLGEFAPRLMFAKGDSEELAEKLFSLIAMSQEERNRLGKNLRAIIERDHSLPLLISKIIRSYN